MSSARLRVYRDRAANMCERTRKKQSHIPRSIYGTPTRKHASAYSKICVCNVGALIELPLYPSKQGPQNVQRINCSIRSVGCRTQNVGVTIYKKQASRRTRPCRHLENRGAIMRNRQRPQTPQNLSPLAWESSITFCRFATLSFSISIRSP